MRLELENDDGTEGLNVKGTKGSWNGKPIVVKLKAASFDKLSKEAGEICLESEN